MSDKVKVLLIMGVAVVISAIGEALAAKGMKAISETQAGSGLMAQVGAALSDWHILVGVGLLLGYVALYVYALGLTELSFALPLSAASYLLGTLLAKYYLGEDVKPVRWIGTAIIIAGVLVVALGGSGGGEDDKEKDKGGEQVQAMQT